VKSEEQAKILLADWLQRNGNEVWWEQKNRYGYDVFRVLGTSGSKPDLLFRNKHIRHFYAIEVKSGDKSKGILSASKIIDYYSDFVSGKAKYYVNGDLIGPLHFLVATSYSIENRIFKNDTLITEAEKSDGRKLAISYGMVPKEEYHRTSDYVRSLWEEWRRRKIRTKPHGIGILLAEICSPILFVQEISWRTRRWRQWVIRFPTIR